MSAGIIVNDTYQNKENGLQRKVTGPSPLKKSI